MLAKCKLSRVLMMVLLPREFRFYPGTDRGREIIRQPLTIMAGGCCEYTKQGEVLLMNQQNYPPNGGEPPYGGGHQPGGWYPPGGGRPNPGGDGGGKGLAIASMVLGIAGLTVFPIIPSIVGLILAIVAKRNGSGGAFATAGLVCSIVGLAIYALVIIACGGVFLAMLGESGWERELFETWSYAHPHTRIPG